MIEKKIVFDRTFRNAHDWIGVENKLLKVKAYFVHLILNITVRKGTTRKKWPSACGRHNFSINIVSPTTDGWDIVVLPHDQYFPLEISVAGL